MVLITRFHKKCRIANLRVCIIATAVCAFLMPTIKPVQSVGNNIFTLYVNGTEIGRVADSETADRLMATARRNVVGSSSNIVLIEAESEIVGDEIIRGTTDPESVMIAKLEEVYNASIKETMQHSYTVKIDEYMVNVSSQYEALKLLEASIRRYDNAGQFDVNLVSSDNRELPVLVPDIIDTSKEVEVKNGNFPNSYLSSDGMIGALVDVVDNADVAVEEGFDNYKYGITNISFVNNIEVVESYLPASQITPLTTAIEEVTKDKEQKTIYEVVAGDTLSGISAKTGISIDEIIALNDNITSVNSVIRIGDEITITVPKPELSVMREELVYYEGTYEADIIYVDNNDWYTYAEETLQEPSSGYHKAVEKVTYLNNEVISTEVVYHEVIAEAVPRIIEKGTKIPPTYIRPVTSNVITSYFGGRTSLIPGMTTYHGAIDYGVRMGTSVMASCGGTVTYAGWMTSYGNVIFISHPDGRQTRYAHLSKILVKKGDYVTQGQKIALSGSTGVSTGPHLHFEMRINGKAVDPLKYISR